MMVQALSDVVPLRQAECAYGQVAVSLVRITTGALLPAFGQLTATAGPLAQILLAGLGSALPQMGRLLSVTLNGALRDAARRAPGRKRMATLAAVYDAEPAERGVDDIITDPDRHGGDGDGRGEGANAVGGPRPGPSG